MMSRTVCALVVVGVLQVGCSENGVRVTCALQDNGKPLAPRENEPIVLTFVAENPKSTMPMVATDYDSAEGVFKIVGTDNELILPGTYKIAITWHSDPDRSRGGSRDYFGGAFSEDKTPLTYTITREPMQELVVDIKSRTVAAK